MLLEILLNQLTFSLREHLVFFRGTHGRCLTGIGAGGCPVDFLIDYYIAGLTRGSIK
jgi:hypothetical protein